MAVQDRTDDGGCIVIDLKSRRRETAPENLKSRSRRQVKRYNPPSRDTHSDEYRRDYDIRNRIFAEILPILEAGVPELSPGGSFRPDFERMLASCKRAVGDFSEFRGNAPAPERERSRELTERLRERRNVWEQMPRERRESLLLQVLGDERLIIRELTERLNAELGEYALYEGNTRSLVMRMFRAGQLERVTETFKNKPRNRYFRKRGLDGPIVDLERAYHDADEGRQEGTT